MSEPGAIPLPATHRSPPRRLWPHGALLASTLVTLSVAGFFWNTGGLSAAGARGAVAYGLMVIAILGAHEMGHFLACRYWRIPATLPFFVPGLPPVGTFGALIRIRGRIPHRRALFDVAVAGPIAGFVVALPIAISALAFGDKLPADFEAPTLMGRPLLFHVIDRVLYGKTMLQALNPMYGAAWVGMLVTSLNLFPVGQLDGGHTAYALSRRFHSVIAWITIVAFGAWNVSAIVRGDLPPFILWLGILIWLRDRHPPLLDESSRIGPVRHCVALLVLLIFVLALIPTPIVVSQP